MLVTSASLITLTACANYNLDNLASTAETIDDDVSNLISELNTVFDTESNLHPTFEEDLGSNPDLDQFADQSANVFNNIQTRSESLSKIQDLSNEIADHGEYLGSYDGEELDVEETKRLADQFAELSNQLDSYTEEYTTYLDQENNFFTSLGSNDAGPETLIEGVETVNANHESLANQASQINQSLDNLLSQIESFQAAISQAQDQEGE